MSVQTELDEETRVKQINDAIWADIHWINDQFPLGTFESYGGSFIAVANKRLIAHDPDQLEVRRKAHEAEPTIPIERFVVSYVATFEQPY